MSNPIYTCLVIGEDHYNTLNVIRALGVEGIKTDVVIVSHTSKSFVLKSKYVSSGQIVSNLNIDRLIQEHSLDKIKIPIITTSDSIAAFLDTYYDRLSKKFILPSVKKTQGALLSEMDKNIQLPQAKEVGFDIPSSKSIILNDAWISQITNINYPCIVKPEKSILGSKSDFRVCSNNRELENALRNLSGRISKVLIQDYIPNNEVILVAGVRTPSGKNHIYGEINKLKHSSKTESLGLSCYGILNSNTKIHDKCVKLVENIDYFGCYSIEVIRISNKNRTYNYFIEINLRTDGLLYFYTKAGINYPALWVLSCYNSELDITSSKASIYGMNEFLYLKNSLSIYSFKDLLNTDVFSIWNIHDPAPFFYKLKYHEKH